MIWEDENATYRTNPHFISMADVYVMPSCNQIATVTEWVTRGIPMDGPHIEKGGNKQYGSLG
jgi:hypothetical protein